MRSRRTWAVATAVLTTCLTTACTAGTAQPPPTIPSTPPSAAPVASVPAKPGEERWYPTDLRPGDCVKSIAGDQLVTLVPCARPHIAEFAAVYVLPDGPWPGYNEVQRMAENGCLPRVHIKESRHATVGVSEILPFETTWPRSRTAYCLAVPAAGGTMRGHALAY
ncbi:septum formation family protein [Nonomuraea sediminis]|uniref:septum formation family protein n=1 Tax=Nonomuraea sediminis TaxID=2835864 RepID=UPI001BDDB2C3|nr:septum formation family protein [Nonomuraea sediminis]